MTLDFDHLRKRLQQSLGGDSNGAHIEKVLKERSRQLAALRITPEERQQLGEVVVVRRAESRIAFPIAHVLEVREVRVSRLPHRTRYICGLFPLRGQVHCLVDLRPFMGHATELAHGERTLAVLIQSAPGVLGVRVDEVVGPRTVYADEIDSGRRERRLDFVSDVTRDCVEIIDVDVLIQSKDLRMASA